VRGRIGWLFVALLLCGCATLDAPVALSPASDDAVIYMIGRGWHSDICLPVDEIAAPLTTLTLDYIAGEIGVCREVIKRQHDSRPRSSATPGDRGYSSLATQRGHAGPVWRSRKRTGRPISGSAHTDLSARSNGMTSWYA
jgi:hypothetical protein